MVKVRIYEVAKELGINSKEVVTKAKEIDIEAKTASSAINSEDAEKLMHYVMTGEKPEKTEKADETPKKKETKVVEIVESKKEEVKPKKSPPKTKSVKKEEAPIKSKEDPVNQEAVVKEEPKVIDEPPKKIEEPKESLAHASLKKRRGLVIVKKKKTTEEPKESFDTKVEKKPSKPTKTAEDLAKIFDFPKADENALKDKKKKKVKKQPTAKKDNTQKIDLLDGDLSDISGQIEEEMVVLPDFTSSGITVEKKQPRKDKNQDKTRTVNNRNNFEQKSIKRVSRKKTKKRPQPDSAQEVKSVEIPEEVRVYEFAEKVGKQPSEIIKALFTLGVMVTKNDFLDKDAIEILADEFEIEVTTINVLEELDYTKDYHDDDLDEHLEEKPPVVTIMGHVDHGKTSLLDYIRNAKVADGEAGGITQHVGAYMIEKDDKKITFVDTPGHEAFTEMRARGASVTDIVIIVVAADDGVKPQTIEAIDHAKAADVPIIVAINKIDKPAANIDLVMGQLSEIGITSVEWGGEYEFAKVSAKSGEGIDELLDLLLLQAEVMELKANPDRDAKTVVIESSVQKGRGPVATVICQNGTLRVGNNVVAGVAYGKVRALLNDLGKNIEAIHPGEPGVIVGLSETPEAGETLIKVDSERTSRDYAFKRAEYIRQKELSKSTKVTIDELSSMIAEGEIKKLPIILKADVSGSLEALKASLAKAGNDETKVHIVHSGIGGINESDVTLANASENCIILGFNVRPTGSAKTKAKRDGVEINTYSIIYDLIDDVNALLSGMLSPIIKEESVGIAEIRDVFVVPKIGAIAGCMVTEGTINRGHNARVIRDGVVIYDSKISSLKRFKDDAKEVARGYECGIGIENFNDLKAGDSIETYQNKEVAAEL
jgi:translation initiation factor IF-2